MYREEGKDKGGRDPLGTERGRDTHVWKLSVGDNGRLHKEKQRKEVDKEV